MGLTPHSPLATQFSKISEMHIANSPQLLLRLGNDAYDAATAKLDKLLKDFVKGKKASREADFPKE